MATSKINKKETEKTFVFNRENYILLLSGLALIAIGMIMLVGGGSDDPDVFSYELFSFTRMTIAPLLILAGLVVEIFAIMKRPKTD